MCFNREIPRSITRIWSRLFANSVSVSGGISSFALDDSSDVANSSGTRLNTSRILCCVSSPVNVKKNCTIGSPLTTGWRAISVRNRNRERRLSSRNCESAIYIKEVKWKTSSSKISSVRYINYNIITSWYYMKTYTHFSYRIQRVRIRICMYSPPTIFFGGNLGINL